MEIHIPSVTDMRTESSLIHKDILYPNNSAQQNPTTHSCSENYIWLNSESVSYLYATVNILMKRDEDN